MAGLEGLTSLVYHERQQQGSMLCAQHALNSLLQGPCFSAPDLARLAESIDAQERASFSQNEGPSEHTSTNMDDTGFFSVQVMEKALGLWGLSLLRWQSEQMRPYHATPYTQLGFILNQNQHWYTLRRFGPLVADMNKDPGEGHWYNLNSTLASPEWISRTYLGMFIQQAEADGYSVFVVCQADPTQPLALPHTEADDIASTLIGPDRASVESDATLTNPYPNTMGERPGPTHLGVDEEDDDWQMQMALQASLMNGGEIDEDAFQAYRASVQAEPARPPGLAPAAAGASGANVDPIEASLARNRALMEQMRRQQEAALRMTYEDEQAQFGDRDTIHGPLIPREMLFRQGILQTRPAGAEEDEDVEVEEQQRPAEALSTSTSTGVRAQNRTYDDEDAELQAALKASLENMPEGYSLPDETVTAARDVGHGEARPAEEEEDEKEKEIEAELDMDEIRRRRLAKFAPPPSQT